MSNPRTAAEICQRHIEAIEDWPGVGPTAVANLRAAVLDLLYLTRSSCANTLACSPTTTRRKAPTPVFTEPRRGNHEQHRRDQD